MDPSEEWSASGVAYTELVYTPIITSGYAPRNIDSRGLVRTALRGAALNKMIFALFTMAGAVFPFLLYEIRLEVKLAITLSVAVSLSLLLVFGYIVLYCVQVLPSFVATGSFAPLTILPLSSREISVVAAMTLWRTLDYILLASLTSQLAATAYFTGSMAATLVVAFASVSSSLLAVGLALSLTTVFQRRLEGGRLSGVRAFLRPVYFILWGLGVMSAVFIFSLISYVSPRLVAALANPHSLFGILLSLVLPFSAGIISAHFQGQDVSNLSLILGVVGLVVAAATSAGASGIILRVIKGVAVPLRESNIGGVKASLSFKVRGPLPAYILKDIRVSSRNPATGFLFALPLFEIIAVVIPLTATSVVKMSVILVGAQVGGGFALFIAFLLVTVEDLGVERRTALPFSESVRTLSKVMVSTAGYVAVPCALALALFGKRLTFGAAALVPALAIGSVFAACIVEVLVLRTLSEGGYGTAAKFTLGVGSGEFVLVLPILAYVVAYASSHAHLQSLASFAVVTVLELAAAMLLMRATDNHATSMGGSGVRSSSPFNHPASETSRSPP